MSEYHKIDSLFKRDPATKYKSFLMWDFSRPEFKYLDDCEWEWTEKIDGTNIRIIWDGEKRKVSFGGRTDRAHIPAQLTQWMIDTFTADKLESVFHDAQAVIYGEGCGAKIQKGGGNYGATQRVIGFDVKVGPWWLRRDDVEDICREVGIDFARSYGVMDYDDAISQVRAGLISQVGSFVAEGLVGRPKVELLDRAGRRIITKLKVKDFALG